MLHAADRIHGTGGCSIVDMRTTRGIGKIGNAPDGDGAPISWALLASSGGKVSPYKD